LLPEFFCGTDILTFVNKNLQSVVLVGDQLSVVAKPGYSGVTKVMIEVENGGEIERIATTVTVLPLPAVSPVVKPATPTSTLITWEKSTNASSYVVTDENGITLCTTTRAQCRVNVVIPASNSVEIVARGRDNLVSEPVEATYIPKAVPTPPAAAIVPKVSVVVNFDTNKYSLTSQEKRELDAFVEQVILGGYKELDISGHTDSVGGVDNKALSLNRAKETRDYLLSFVPDLKITLGGFADAVSVANNGTTAGKAANRRAEVRIVR
jgi:outer membrane protein OmpA-like peptidoglycan-associated protein